MIELEAGDYRLRLNPERGGSVARFDWRDEPLFRPTCGPSILDTACFPLVPFSNRIANGSFNAGGEAVRILPNMPGSDHPHPLHGFGWLSAWDVIQHDGVSATMVHCHPGGEWRWAYRATQRFSLAIDGLTMALELQNESLASMPAGLGFHPYLPRNGLTLYRGLHCGEWSTGHDGLPIALDEGEKAVDWWRGSPVDTRSVDTVYTDRTGGLQITWPDRRIELLLRPSLNLRHTVVYVPAAADYFCVEPVSHMTDAMNRSMRKSGLQWLGPGEIISADVTAAASTL